MSVFIVFKINEKSSNRTAIYTRNSCISNGDLEVFYFSLLKKIEMFLLEEQDQNQDKVHHSLLLEKTKNYSEYREERV